MSYDISLCDPITKKVLHFEEPHDMKGGTYALGGTTKMWLNVTYNYVHIFRKVIDKEKGIRFLYGLTGEKSIPILEKAMSQLADDIDDDYWKPTEGNAKEALKNLLILAQTRPDGIWMGD
jgi:hypothetical protein